MYTATVQVQRCFSGYGVYQKVAWKLKSQKCTTLMTRTQSDLSSHTEALIKAKNYKNDRDLRLLNPDNRVFEVCRSRMMWYGQLFSKYAHYSSVRTKMLSVIKKKTDELFVWNTEKSWWNFELQLSYLKMLDGCWQTR